MAETGSIEERLAVLEREVADLRDHIRPTDPAQGWLHQVAGSLKDDPEFDEELKLGRAIRQADSCLVMQDTA